MTDGVRPVAAGARANGAPAAIGWIGRTTHRLRSVDGARRIAFKKMVLVNATEPLPNFAFLI